MLQFALREKGVITTSHYSLPALPSNSPLGHVVPSSLQVDENTIDREHRGGVDL